MGLFSYEAGCVGYSKPYIHALFWDNSGKCSYGYEPKIFVWWRDTQIPKFLCFLWMIEFKIYI